MFPAVDFCAEDELLIAFTWYASVMLSFPLLGSYLSSLLQAVNSIVAASPADNDNNMFFFIAENFIVTYSISKAVIKN
jgi:hypothetical protein